MSALPETTEELFRRIHDIQVNNAKLYESWPDKHELDVTTMKYAAPFYTVQALCDVIKSDPALERSTCSVIDFAAGTGLSGQELRRAGFTGTVDAQDGSEHMLRQAKGDLYRRKFCCLLEKGAQMPGELATGCYDVAIMCVGLSPSQVLADCLYLMLDAVRVGGYVVVTVRSNPAMLAFVETVDTEVRRWIDAGLATVISRQEHDGFELADVTPVPNTSLATPVPKYFPRLVCVVRKC